MTDERKRVVIIMSLIYEQNQDLNDEEYQRTLEAIRDEIDRVLKGEPRSLFDEEESK